MKTKANYPICHELAIEYPALIKALEVAEINTPNNHVEPLRLRCREIWNMQFNQNQLSCTPFMNWNHWRAEKYEGKTELDFNITDDDQLVGARSEFGHVVRTYDDGFGGLWIARDSMGIDGIIRAQTFEDAWSVWEDEMAPEPDDEDITEAALIKEYGEDWQDDGAFQESYGYRPNSNGKSGMYVKDLNGNHLDTLTPALAKELKLILIIRPFEWEGDNSFVPSLPLL